MKKIVSATLPQEMIEEIQEIARLSKRTFSFQLELFLESALKEMKQDEEVE